MVRWTRCSLWKSQICIFFCSLSIVTTKCLLLIDAKYFSFKLASSFQDVFRHCFILPITYPVVLLPQDREKDSYKTGNTIKYQHHDLLIPFSLIGVFDMLAVSSVNILVLLHLTCLLLFRVQDHLRVIDFSIVLSPLALVSWLQLKFGGLGNIDCSADFWWHCLLWITVS